MQAARRVKGKFGLFRNRMSAHLLIIIDFGFLKAVSIALNERPRKSVVQQSRMNNGPVSEEMI